jgi:hypothetical protein
MPSLVFGRFSCFWLLFLSLVVRSTKPLNLHKLNIWFSGERISVQKAVLVAWTVLLLLAIVQVWLVLSLRYGSQ